MRKIKIVPNNGKNTLYVNGTPNLDILSKQDYDAFISSLELEIRNYYKGQWNKDDGSKFGQPP